MHGLPAPKSKFAPFEDSLLIDAVQTHGHSDWALIATLIPGRNARQCRERWTNYVNPHLTHTAWTEADDEILLQKFAELGSKWHIIAGFFNGRGKNAVRNRFLALQRQKSRDRLAAAGGRAHQPRPWPSTPLNQDIAVVTPPADPPAQDILAFLDAGAENGTITWQTEWDSFPSCFF
jgi:hypothetical protein